MGISHVRKAADQPGNPIPDWDVSWEFIPDISQVWEPTTDIPGPRERVKLINQAWDGWGGEFSPYALYNYPHLLVFYRKGFTKLISTGVSALHNIHSLMLFDIKVEDTGEGFPCLLLGIP